MLNYRSDDPSDGLSSFAPPPQTPYTNPGQTAQVSSNPGVAMSPSGYTPGQTYMPSPMVTTGTSAQPAYGYGPVAGESLYARSRERDTVRGLYGRDSLKGPATQAGPPTLVLELATIQDVRQQIFNMDEAKLRELQKQLGVKPTGFADPATVGVVDDFLGYVSDINASGVQKTWREVLADLSDKEGSYMNAVTGGGAGAEEPFTGSRTTVDENVRTLSKTEARGYSEAAYAAALGRAPTRRERIALRAAFNARAENNPIVTTTTTDYDEGIVTGSSSITDGGPDFAQMALNAARAEPGYAEHQAATTYFDAMMAALSAPGGA